MSNGDEERSGDTADGETAETDEPAGTDEGDTVLTIEAFESRLDDAETMLEAAETEADLDAVEGNLDEIESDLDAAELRVPESGEEAADESDEEDEGDEEPEDPAEPLESRIEDLQEEIDAQRGPYGEDVEAAATAAAGVIRDTRWTHDGEPAVLDAGSAFLKAVEAELEAEFGDGEEDTDTLAEAVESVGETAVDGRLDADEDADTIAALLDAVEELDAALEDAEEWAGLEIAEQFRREGFYDRLTSENRKDFPPELAVVRIAEKENDPERILAAMEALDSEFMQDNCIDALRRLGPEEAFEPVDALAQRREVGAIEVLGKIGDDRAVETLVDFVDSGNPPLQKATLRALGEIGSEEASQPIANALADEEPAVRSIAARALGLVGDPRAIEPLSDRLDDDEENDEVRASAAWALVQIGTERALEAAASHHDDRAYTVQVEAERARDATA